MKDLRRFPRAPINTSFSLLGQAGAIKGKAKNISPVGVFVCTDRTLPVGEQVYINVYLPRYHGAVISQAEVVWTCSQVMTCRNRGMGLKFVDLGLLDVFRLDNFVRHSRES